MKAPVLVTVSGMVGTGKTTAVKRILAVVERQGVEASHWRFQRLPCITLRPAPKRVAPARGPKFDGIERGRGYRPRPLTAVRALGQVVRIIAFRIFRRWPPSRAWAVSNRYFYDSFAHYDLDLGAGRFYARVLARLVPKPDLAFLMVASPQTLAARRPQYSAEYITTLERAYRQLRQIFPHLIEVNTEADRHALERIEAIVQHRLSPGPSASVDAHGDHRG